MTTLGKIIKSNSHIDYVCQVDGPGEVEHPPTPEEYALGTWVGVPVGTGEEETAVGLVYDTQLYNPDYGTFGPRLSSQSQLEVFSPDYLNETAVLLGIILLGRLGEDTGTGYCPVAPQVGATVRCLTPTEVRAFHDRAGSLDLSYYGLLLATGNPVVSQLMLGVLDSLADLMPEQARVLEVLRTDLAWKSRVAVRS